MNYKIALSRKGNLNKYFHTVGLSAMKGKIVSWNGRDTINSIIVLLKLIFGTRIFIILEHNDILFVFGALRYIIHFRSSNTYGT